MRKITRFLIPVIIAITIFSVNNDNVSSRATYIASVCKTTKMSTGVSDILLSVYKPNSELTHFTYYSQIDPLWENYKYGGRDSMAKYGCGPTVLAMLVSNLTKETLSPVEAADWSSQNGYYSPGGGSMHNLIPDGAKAFGLKVESLSVLSPDALLMPLQYGKLIVLLMGPGHFTQKGHFIILTDVTNDGKIIVADPYNPDNNMIPWDPQIILDELSAKATAGGPAWVVSRID